MKHLSEKITDFIVKAGAISEKSYAVYQYGFQIGLEMLSCFLVCFSIAIYLRMIPEFVVLTFVFMLLRTYAGGVHLKSFSGCFICSVLVQTVILKISGQYMFPIIGSWLCIIMGLILILFLAPVENINRELDEGEKKHCKKVIGKIVIGIILFALFCTFSGFHKIISLIVLTVLVVLISQYIGILKYKIEKGIYRRK